MFLGQASGMAFLGTLPCGKSCYISINGNAKSSWFERKKLYSRKYFLGSKRTGHKRRKLVLEWGSRLLAMKQSEPYVTEDELKLMLRGAELSGAIEEEEQLQLMRVPLVDFHSLWVTHQYSRVPVFEQRVDNIVGIAYAMDLLDYVQKGDLLESTTVGDMAHKPAYFVPDSMSVWNLLREFRIRKVHMAVVLNEYGGTVGVVTLEDVVEEIVGEIFDENDSKEEIQKKTGYIVMRAEGIYDVDANTSIDQLSEDLNIKMPELCITSMGKSCNPQSSSCILGLLSYASIEEGHQYETVSGFICEAFGYIPRTGESMKVVLEKENQEENEEHDESGSDHQELKEKYLIYKLEILAGNARKVGAVRFERMNNDEAKFEAKEVTRLVPKIMKRKWSSDDEWDSNDYDGDAYSKRVEDDPSGDHVIAEHEDGRHDSAITN
ncbi:hypothetical protein Patl1_04001 [Pistacia atlantica]|uniref:Uncharacterized protein n=1 Tax=Pistacia atlantica TaxID=434234 RepID=A0ACC1BSV7_9ROSI|nr:hypothetical protein Patl1_04001 [Pistacia atlantica]